MHYNGKTYVGSIASDGDVLVHTYNHGTDVMSAATTLKAAMEVDDHDHPALLIRDSDKRLVAFYSKHDLSPVYRRISTNPEDATAWGSEVDLNSQLGAGGVDYTYPVPVQLLAETNDPIHLFLRDIPSGSSTAKLVRSLSTDGGSTFGARTTIYTSPTGSFGYWKIVQNGDDRIDFAVTNAHPGDSATSLYHFYYEAGNYYRSNGTQILTALPLTIADLTLVYDGSSERCWVADIAVDASGHPVIAFPTYPAVTTHRLRYARWDGAAWDVSTILDNAGRSISTAGGAQDYYLAGMSVDPTDPDVVYVGRQVLSGWEIWRYETTDGGATFTGAAVTENTDAKHFRPVVPRNRATDLPVLWLQGTYPGYTSWSAALRGLQVP